MIINRSLSKECLDNIITKIFTEYYNQKENGIEGTLDVQLPTFLNAFEKKYIVNFIREHITTTDALIELKRKELNNAWSNDPRY